METPSAEFQVYPKRFGIVFLFSLIQMMTSCLMNTLTPIASYLTLIYHEDPVVVNLGGLFFTLMHPIFTFPAAYVIDTYGARVGIITGCVLCLVGTCVRMLINEAFVFVIIGQVIAGIGRPFILHQRLPSYLHSFECLNILLRLIMLSSPAPRSAPSPPPSPSAAPPPACCTPW